jgi:zinc protease
MKISRCALGLAFFLALGSCSCVLPGKPETPALTQAELNALPREVKMPLNPAVRHARLANGLTYYILRNEDPEGRAELRFVVKAGSLLEEDDQQGFAHFLEHMLFNGTERFPGMDVLAFLQSTGMQVGADVNAYTNHDETVCVIKVPTDNPTILPTAFDVMEDWATAVSLDPEEVDSERGVITEERRSQALSASGRISKRIGDLYVAGSRYAERSPIGKLEVIQKGSRDRLEAFYKTWYRPENLSIVAVGDFDPAEVEALILERFAKLENPPGPAPKRPEITLAEAGTTYAVLTDPEQSVTNVALTWRRPGLTFPTVGGYQQYLVSILFDRMMNARLLELTEAENSPVIQAAAGRGLFVRAVELWTAQALAPEGGEQKALEAMLTEIERVRRHGFSEAELARAKRDILTTYERAAAENQNTPSSSLADELVRHVTDDEPVIGIVAERAFTERFVPDITLADMNAEAAQLGSTNRIVLLLAPEKEGLKPSNEAALANVVARVEKAEIADYTEEIAGAELMPNPPQPAAIASRRDVPELGATELVLANGARVLYKPTKLREREVLFTATSPGGASVVPDEDYTEARVAGAVAAESGVAGFSRPDLLKVLAGKDLTVVPSVDAYYEGMDGGARSEDLEALFQMIHLYFTAPRQDKAVVTRVTRELVSRLENRKSVPEAVLQQAVEEALYGKTVRAGALPLDELRKVDADRLFKIYRERFADAADFTFAFVGSFEPAQLEALAQQYLGTLPAKGSREKYTPRLRQPPQEVVTRTLNQGKEERSVVNMVFEGPLDATVTPELQVQANLLEQAISGNLQSELREKRGAVYGVLLEIDLAEAPSPMYRATISFTTDPHRVDELVGVVLDEIELLRESPPSRGSLELSKEYERRQRQEARGQNSFWLGVLEHWAKFPDSDPRDVLEFEADLFAVTPEQVQALGEQIFRKDRYVKVVLQPQAGS